MNDRKQFEMTQNKNPHAIQYPHLRPLSGACQGMSPSFCRARCGLPVAKRAVELPPPPLPPLPLPPEPMVPELTLRRGVADASDAVLLIFFGASADPPFLPGVSEPLLFVFAAAGLRPGFNVGIISFASSRTRTAPSPPPRLKRSTTPNKPYFSTSIARLGCTSHTVLRILNRLRRTTALLLWPRRSIIRLKNADDFAMLMATGADRRVILRKGSRRFSKELAFAVTKHRSSASMDSGFVSSSSTLEVSSCNLYPRK